MFIMGFGNKIKSWGTKKEKERPGFLPTPDVDVFTPLPIRDGLHRKSDGLGNSTGLERERRPYVSLSPRPPSILHPQNGAFTTFTQAASEETRLIIGIDYGTSHSGAAWTLLNSGDLPHNADISIVRGWAGDNPGEFTSNKVSSDLAYDAFGNLYWGFDIPQRDDIRKLRWLKLLLEPEPKLKNLHAQDEIAQSREILREIGLTEIEAAADYLRKLWGHIQQEIISVIGQGTFDYAKKTIVLSVPAVWSPRARKNTHCVAIEAGLSGNDLSLHMVDEPQAAAIAILSERRQSPKLGDCYVVCDAGSGTVDLISYQIKRTDPLKISEKVVGESGLCGSVFLDIAFKNFLSTFLGGDVHNAPPQNLAKMMSDFEYGIKRQFTDNDTKTYSLFMPGCQDNPRIQLMNGRMTLTKEHLYPLFQKVISDIESLIRRQLQALDRKNLTPKAILLVGDFGSSKYLHGRLRQRYGEPRNGKTIEILQPDMSWESVSTWAVRCELLGIGNIVPTDSSVHMKKRGKRGIRSNGSFGRYATELDLVVFVTLMQVNLQGQEIKDGTPTSFEFHHLFAEDEVNWAADSVQVKASLMRSDDNDAPSRITETVHLFVTVPFRIKTNFIRKHPRVMPDKKYYRVPTKIEMMMGSAELEFWSNVDGEKEKLTQVDIHTPLPSQNFRSGPLELPA
ncbi:hypothetical protein GP486_000939 [Trichoglossum hirsutum]|uniref:Hsp70 family chaperone n=1 Tax=Trichoglossum hirsutum TaxID=265104 RepID=A0A9P8RT33_9PEZI|nr:hypothetical protein GP486_000939 [Trichoglossum hirsutum]